MSWLKSPRCRFFVVGLLLILSLLLWKTFSYLPDADLSPSDSEKNSLANDKEAQVELHGEDIPIQSPLRPLKVAVYYEALCPDSRSFIVRQLVTAFQKAPRLIKLELVPYGKATTLETATGDIVFQCQHGEVECVANKIHACAIHYSPSTAAELEYVACMITDNRNPEEAGRKCAQESRVAWEQVKECASGPEGDLLLKKHGDATHGLHPKVSFIPTIAINDSQDGQPEILKDFLKALCSRYMNEKPPECS